jgi:hypothetical protein
VNILAGAHSERTSTPIQRAALAHSQDWPVEAVAANRRHTFDVAFIGVRVRRCRCPRFLEPARLSRSPIRMPRPGCPEQGLPVRLRRAAAGGEAEVPAVADAGGEGRHRRGVVVLSGSGPAPCRTADHSRRAGDRTGTDQDAGRAGSVDRGTARGRVGVLPELRCGQRRRESKAAARRSRLPIRARSRS